MRRPGQPGEDRIDSGDRRWLAGRDPELHERDEAPVSADPLVVGVAAEAAVGLLAVEQSPHDPPGQNVLVIGRFAQQVAAHEPPDRWLGAVEQPFDHRRAGGRGRHAGIVRRPPSTMA